MEAQKFRMKPVEIEAIQWLGGNETSIKQWAAQCGASDKFRCDGSAMFIETTEGRMYASIGDWIIRGVIGEFYPCKPDVFAATYDQLTDRERAEQIAVAQPGQKTSTSEMVAEAGAFLQTICHGSAVSSGWWSCPKTGEPSTREYITEVLFSKKINLIHSEISEAVEAERKGLKDSHLPHRDGVEVELADAIIRIFDLGGALGYSLGGAIAEKMRFNASRQDHKLESRIAEHGKRY